MAEEIKPTPVLSGEDADEFLKKMFEPPTEEEIAYMKEAMKMFKNHDPFKD